MKPKPLIAVLIAAALMLLLARFLWPVPQAQPQNQPPENSLETSRQTPYANIGNRASRNRRELEGRNGRSAPSEMALEPLPPGRSLHERLDEISRLRGVPLNMLTQQAFAQWSNGFQEMSQQVNRLIEFFGTVVDEKGLPLGGVNVLFGCVIFPGSQFTTNLFTDDHGMFALGSVTGAILNVQVRKEGYELVPGTNQTSFVYYSPSGIGSFSPDSSNPIVFHLRKKVSE